MNQEKETQDTTEQFYSNVDESAVQEIIPNKEVEQAYSLEDLHPEENGENKVVVPPISSPQEIQPDPTVIDGIKAPIGDMSSQLDSQVQRVPFSTNVLEPSMQKQAIVHASQTQKIQVQQKVDKAQDNDSSAKVFYAVIGLILLGIVVGLPVYSSVTKMNSNSSGTSETIDKEPIEGETDDNLHIDEPLQTPGKISFDMSLSFDKGLVSNEKEINQKSGFLPTSLTGVIRCDLERPVVTEGITNYASTYLYYENYKLKSAIAVTKQVYGDELSYETNKDATLVYKDAGDKNDSLDVEIQKDDENRIVTNIMQYNLQYGNSTYIEALNTNILFSSHFNTNIKTAIENVIVTGANSGNAVCSALDTSNFESSNETEAGL